MKGDVVPIGRSKNFIFLSAIALAVIACSQRPSESDARQMLEAYYRKRFGSGAEVQVANLKKTDGLAEVEKGAKYYTMEYQGEVVFPKGYNGYTLYGGSLTCKAAQGYKENGRLRFVRTENGWKLVDASSEEVFNTCDVNGGCSNSMRGPGHC
jgi:hypothetical protein